MPAINKKKSSAYNALLEGLLNERVFDRKYTPEKQQSIFEISGRVIGTLENIVVLSGLPKAGKSTFLHALIASAFQQLPIFGMKLYTPVKRKVVCYFDTESSTYDFYRGVWRIKRILQKDIAPDNLHAYMFRDLNSQEIRECIEYYLQCVPDCGICIIDGLLDLLLNYNDETESRHCIDWLKRITKQYNVLLIGVIHMGKSNLQTLGTFGSMIDRYCQSNLSVEKNKELRYELKPKFMRADADFPPIVIGKNEDGSIYQL